MIRSDVRMGAILLVLSAMSVLPVASAQKTSSSSTTRAMSGERERNSYMIGMDVGRSIAPAGPDMDFAAFERAIRNAFDGGKPVLGEEETQAIGRQLVQRIAARTGKAAPGAKPAAIDRTKVGLLVGSDVGRSLQPIKAEIALPVLLDAVRARVQGKPLALTEAEADALRDAFTQRLQAKQQADAAAAAGRNRAEGAAFMAKNKAVKGVFSTPSGLQYMVLRQGAGVRPKPGERVRVHYQGTLLDGTVFDSSYERGQPAEFGLDQVIRGWGEAVAMMPVGAKYRFWIPGELAYGEQGTGPGGIGPNATLVFDIELLGIAQ